MRLTCIGLLAASFLLGTFGCSAGRAVTPARDGQITHVDLADRPVIGRLGVPLGRVVTVMACIVAGRDLNDNALQSEYLLRVMSVEGTTLRSDVVMRFELAPGSNALMAPDTFKLYELKNGVPTDQLADDQITNLEQGYVGRRVSLALYETGSDEGIPGNLPENISVWQDVGFTFATSLVVLAER